MLTNNNTLSPLLKISHRHALVTAGSGTLSVLAVHPFDVLRSKLQVNGGVSSKSRYEMIREKPYSGFHLGLGVNYLSWYLYGFTREGLRNSNYLQTKVYPHLNLKPIKIDYIEGLIASLLMIPIVHPMHSLKTRVQINGSGMTTELVNLQKDRKLLILYKGIKTSFILCINPLLQRYLFTEFKKLYDLSIHYIRKKKDEGDYQQIKNNNVDIDYNNQVLSILRNESFSTGFCAFGSKFIGTILMYPLLTYRALETNERSAKKFRDLYRGIEVNIFKTSFQTAFHYVVFGVLKKKQNKK